VTANGERTSPLRTEARDGLRFARATGSASRHGQKNGKSYMLVTRLPEAQIAELARPLESRF
jgi:hypothetical protein